MITRVWPEPDSSAAGVRDVELAEMFCEWGWEVTLASTSLTKAPSVYSTLPIEMNSPQFAEQLRALGPDVVVFDTFIIEEQFGWQVREALPGTLRVLDTQDLHFIRKSREQALGQATLEQIKNLEIPLDEDTKLRELAAILRSDLTLVLSDFEMNWLKKHVDPELLVHLPITLETQPVRKDGQDFLFMGNFRHAPNRGAVHWLAEEIWPLIHRELPNTQLNIYGAYVPKEIKDLQGLQIRGHAKDKLRVFSEHRVSLAPLRFGAGQKGKIMESWAAGTPTVSTPIGYEGLRADDLPAPVTARAFAEEAARVYQNPGDPRPYAEKFRRDRWSPQFRSKLESAKQNLESRRQDNMVGAILAHEFHGRTKYLSKWIEAKNESRHSKS